VEGAGKNFIAGMTIILKESSQEGDGGPRYLPLKHKEEDKGEKETEQRFDICCTMFLGFVGGKGDTHGAATRPLKREREKGFREKRRKGNSFGESRMVLSSRRSGW